MRIQELVSHLETLFPTFYMFPTVNDHTPPPNPPFICYVPSQESLYADNLNYNKKNTYTIEYYFTQKNPNNEQLIETKLNELGYTFSRSEDAFIDDMFVIYYQI